MTTSIDWTGDWVRQVWAQFSRRLDNPELQPRVPKWRHWFLCVRATLALRMDREVEPDGSEWGTAIAWQSLGFYNTDYGTGQAFAELRVCGFKFMVIEDGTL